MTFTMNFPGIIPILHSSVVIIPGQFGPIRRVFLPSKARRTFTISKTGICSVTHTTISRLASIASKILSAANLAGTNTTEAFAPVFQQLLLLY